MRWVCPGNDMHDVVGACALDCPDACSWVVTVDRGQPVRLRGNSAHPFTQGGLCAKVNPYLAYAANPDRLLHPLRRNGAKGDGQFERISWDDALAEIAERFRAIGDRYGGEAIWPYAGTGSVGIVQGVVGSGQRLFHAVGASRHVANICSVSGHAGMSYTTGSAAGMDPEDLAHSGVILLWGTNTLTTNLHLWPFIRRGRDRGALLVVVDPVRTRTAAQADRHLAPRPGTDAALAFGLMAHLVRLGAADESYLDRWAVGWPEFRAGVLAAWSPERAAEICGVDVAEITELAELMARRGPTGIRCLMGMQRHAGGGQAARVLSCLPAVTGDFARRGGGICYSTGPAYQFNLPALTRPDLQPAGPTRQLLMTRLADGLLTAGDPPVMALLIWAANPMVSNPDQNRVRAGLSRPDLFTVVVDQVHTATTAYADIVLPGTTQLEHLDLHDSYSHLYLNLNQPVTAPPGECLPHTEIFRRLATALGLTEPALFDSDEDLVRAALDSDLPGMAPVTLEQLRERGWVRLDLPTPYLPFADGFPTPSGKFEFVSSRGEADGAGRLPAYTPPAEAAIPDLTEPAGGGRLALIAAANHYLINSTFAGSPLHQRAGSATVTVHPADAVRLGLCDGDTVEVGNARGRFTARLAVSVAVRRGVAATSKGLPPVRPGGSSVNATVAERDSDLGPGAVFHDNAVHIRPVRGGPAGDAAAEPAADAAADPHR